MVGRLLQRNPEEIRYQSVFKQGQLQNYDDLVAGAIEALRRRRGISADADVSRRFWQMRKLGNKRSVFMLVDGGGMYLMSQPKSFFA